MKHKSNLDGKPVYIVDGSRTPFLKAKGIGPFTASDLAVQTGRSLLKRQPFSPTDIDEVIIGCVMAGPDEVNVARVISQRLGCGDKVPAYTVMRNCASGMQALDNAALQISSGRSNLILAGGTEAMSHAPVLLNEKMVSWLGNWFGAKSMPAKLKLLTKLSPSLFIPVMGLIKGLMDPIACINMGQTAEVLAHEFNINREQMDEFSNNSHLRTADAYANGRMGEVTPIIDSKGNLYSEDTGFRANSTVEGLTKLRPYFDKKYGMVTAGNSSQITDGACLLLLASPEAVKQYKLPILGRIVDSQWGALSPSEMGLGPVYAATPILQRQNLKPNDLDCWEINEAFAAQVLGCLSAFDDTKFCQEKLGLKKAIGSPSIDKLNIDGGAIAIGHPVGASGARIVLHLLNSLEQNQWTRGMASICIGGGQGGAMYIERFTEADNK
ncbi:MAG: acetyl-CoA C-acetyltransferase [Legionellaceae bacterium]|nr:acetyl-CoA C-acetyltransferase [Legionellaceae bacterium]